jgi:hypothetical protein
MFADGEGPRNRRSLNCATPDFLSSLMALAGFMRLSSRRGAHAALFWCSVAGNPGSLRFHGQPGQAG